MSQDDDFPKEVVKIVKDGLRAQGWLDPIQVAELEAERVRAVEALRELDKIAEESAGVIAAAWLRRWIAAVLAEQETQAGDAPGRGFDSGEASQSSPPLAEQEKEEPRWEGHVPAPYPKGHIDGL